MEKRQCLSNNGTYSIFCVATKSGKIEKAKLFDIFCIPKESPLSKIVKGIVDYIVEESEKYGNIEDFMAGVGYADEIDVPAPIKKMFDKGMVVFEGCVSNDSGNLVETVFCEIEVKHQEDDLIFWKEI